MSAVSVSAKGGNYCIRIYRCDSLDFDFASGVKGCIRSWLHPYKEQNLVVGDKAMAVFDDWPNMTNCVIRIR
jgi:hypothetical protein